MTQTKVMVRFANGYYGLDLIRRKKPYIAFLGCMPWGTPFAIYTNEETATRACKSANELKEMGDYKKFNDENDLSHLNRECFVMALPFPDILDLFGEYGELVKEPQKHFLLLSEDGDGVSDAALKWAKKTHPEWFENGGDE